MPDIDVIEGQVAQGTVDLAVRAAQIPLKDEAIQINIAVPLGKEAQADAQMGELLAGLDGPSNWLTPEERARRLGSGTVYMLIFGSAAIIRRFTF